jgi:hypothetical protein
LRYLKVAEGEYSQQDDDDDGADEAAGYLFHNQDACYDSDKAKYIIGQIMVHNLYFYLFILSF